MAKSKTEKALIESLGEALEFEKGNKKLKSHWRKLPPPAPKFSKTAVKRLRKEVFHATQEEFARILNVELATLRSWEQGTRTPTKSSQRLLELMSKSPEVIEKLYKKSS